MSAGSGDSIRLLLDVGGGLGHTPLQRRVAGRCHLNWRIDKLVVGSGFEMARMGNYYVKGPRPFGYMFEGVATKARS